jgi:hypothetical protein
MGEILTTPILEDGLARAAHQAFLDDLRRGHHAKLVTAQAMQARFAHALQAAGEETHVEGLGQRVMCVHPDIYWEMIRRYGRDCWNDRDFRRRMMADEPGLRVSSRPRNATVRVNGLRDGSRRSEVRSRTQASAGARTPGGGIS